MSTSREKRLELLMAIADTVESEIDCEKFLDRVAGYVEQLDSDQAPNDELMEVSKHLRNCPECREEFEVLLKQFRP